MASQPAGGSKDFAWPVDCSKRTAPGCILVGVVPEVASTSSGPDPVVVLCPTNRFESRGRRWEIGFCDVGMVSAGPIWNLG